MRRSYPLFNSVKSNFSSSALKGLNTKSSIDEKIGFLSSVNDRIRKYDKVTQVDASVVEKWQQVQIFNTEGLKAEDERSYTRLPTTVIAQDGSEQVRSFAGPEASWAGNIKSHLIQKFIVSYLQNELSTMLC